MNKLGSKLHSEFCGLVLLDMAKTLKEQAAKPNDPLTHYVFGFMMHHVLDRNIHPYVFCKSGSIKWDHQRFEVIMDTLVMKQVLGIRYMVIHLSGRKFISDRNSLIRFLHDG